MRVSRPSGPYGFHATAQGGGIAVTIALVDIAEEEYLGPIGLAVKIYYLAEDFRGIPLLPW